MVGMANKAGKDLISLSEERGSAKSYAALARGLGLVTEQTRDMFDEGESVWVFSRGDVTPRRATVVQTAGPDDDQVLLEFWDGEGEAQLTPRCTVRKAEKS